MLVRPTDDGTEWTTRSGKEIDTGNSQAFADLNNGADPSKGGVLIFGNWGGQVLAGSSKYQHGTDYSDILVGYDFIDFHDETTGKEETDETAAIDKGLDPYNKVSDVANIFYGAGGADNLYGGGGNDSLNGGAGSDLLVPGQGSDTLKGGEGADNYLIDHLTFGTSIETDYITGFEFGETIIFNKNYSKKIEGVETEGIDLEIGNVSDDSEGMKFGLSEGNLDNITIRFTQAKNDGSDAIGKTNEVVLLSSNSSLKENLLNIADEGITNTALDGDTTYSPSDKLSITDDDNQIYVTYAVDEGTEAADFVDASGSIGDLTYTGLAGNDTILTGSGRDTIVTGSGKDSIDAGRGDDSINAGGGDNTIRAGSGDDTINAGSGNDNIGAGKGDDSITASIGADTILAGSGDDTINVSSGYDSIDGGKGNDIINANSNAYGSADTIVGSQGNDTINGGDNSGDVVDYSRLSSGISVNNFFESTAFLVDKGDDGNDTVENVEKIIVSPFFDNRLKGTGGTDVFTLTLSTVLFSTGLHSSSKQVPILEKMLVDIGNEVPVSVTGFGVDTTTSIAGETGTDQVIIDYGEDYDETVPSNFKLGAEIRTTDINLMSLSEVERLVININDTGSDWEVTESIAETGLTSVELNGGDGKDQFVGYSPSNVVYQLNGLGGNDNLVGGNGNDTIDGGKGSDTIDGGSGIDTIRGGSQNDSLGGGSGNDIIYGGSDKDTINGGAGNDTIYGDSGNDSINGGDDNDSIIGGGGHDIINGSFGNDSLYGSGGGDTINGQSGIDTIGGGSGHDSLTGGDGNDSINGGSGNDTIKGGSGSDSIHGSSDNDTIDGNNGNDSINGGSGNDTINGGTGNDTIYGNSGNDSFMWRTLDNSTDRIFGGTGSDLLTLDMDNGSSSASTLLITSASFDASILSIKDTTSGQSVLASGVEDLFVVSDPHGTTVNIFGSLGGTGLDQDTIHFNGSVGDDLLDASGLEDISVEVYGGDGGIDTLLGGARNDILDASGSNGGLLMGNAGDDILIGGNGINEFVYQFATTDKGKPATEGLDDNDVIMDFEVGVDQLILDDIFDVAVQQFGRANSQVDVNDNGTDTTLTFGDDNSITLVGVTRDGSADYNNLENLIHADILTIV